MPLTTQIPKALDFLLVPGQHRTSAGLAVHRQPSTPVCKVQSVEAERAFHVLSPGPNISDHRETQKIHMAVLKN